MFGLILFGYLKLLNVLSSFMLECDVLIVIMFVFMLVIDVMMLLNFE